ncbi:Uncharacterized protein FKW44_013659 [Caligus rogercresseyi]|uniref:Uncharacterized protein n=1 Tax=Caligus rogercresseyi TaxID=217165 RepID=A0A7T8JZE7_CALRO|nr:Uncharacterized protein FKW44_013659 [Caligus rogercresseyi]
MSSPKEKYFLEKKLPIATERQKKLFEGYKFKCTCDACAFKYPLFHELRAQSADGLSEIDCPEKILRIKTLIKEKEFLKAGQESKALLTNLHDTLSPKHNYAAK